MRTCVARATTSLITFINLLDKQYKPFVLYLALHLSEPSHHQGTNMLNHPTYDKLTRLKLFGMARAFAEQSGLDLDHLGFDERLGLLIDHEATERDGKALALRLQRAKLKPNTAAEDIDYRHARGLDKSLVQRLLGGTASKAVADEDVSMACRQRLRQRNDVANMIVF